MSATDPTRPHARDEQGARLHAELELATARAARLHAEYDELLADGALQEDRDAAALLLEHARHQLDSARTAMENFQAGTYGMCVRCGGEIAEERLAALIDVDTCVSCAG